MASLDYLVGDERVLFFCRWMLITFLLLNLPYAFKRNSKLGTNYVLLFAVMFIYCVLYCPVDGDNYTSMRNYNFYQDGIDYKDLHFEKLYFLIMDLIPFGYVYYRMFVWGLACLLCVCFLKRLKIKSQVATLSVLTFALPILLYYQRAAFAYVFLYVAVFCYAECVKRRDTNIILLYLRKTVILALLSCMFVFHTAMPIYVFFLLCSLFLPKNFIGVTCLTIGLIIFSISIVPNSIFLLSYFSSDTIETGLRSLDGDSPLLGVNINGVIGAIIRKLPLYLMVLHGIYKMITQPKVHTSFEKTCLINTLILLVVSYSFSQYSHVIEAKFYKASMMPWTIYIASYFDRYAGTSSCNIYSIATILVSFV